MGRDEAQHTLQQALDSVARCRWEKLVDQVAALGEIIEAQAKSGLEAAALETLHIAEAKLQAMEGSRECVWFASTQLALSLAKAGRFYPGFRSKAQEHADAALRSFSLRDKSIWNGSGKDIHPPHGFVNRVKAVLAAYENRIDDALRSVLQIQDVSSRSTAARDVAIACIDANNSDGFTAALSFVSNRRSELLPDIAQELLTRGDKKGLKQMFQDSVFYLDCTYRILALLLKLYRPDVRTLNEIRDEVSRKGAAAGRSAFTGSPSSETSCTIQIQ